MSKGRKLSFVAIVRLFFFFIYNSIKGGVQVALFALRPRLCLAPYIHAHRLKTESNFATSMLINIYSLMPGTLSMGVEKDTLYLHILDCELFDDEFIARVEEYVIDAFEGRIT